MNATLIAQNILNTPKQSQSPTLDALYKLSNLLRIHRDSNSDEALLWAQAFDVCLVLGERMCNEHDEFVKLVERCDGIEGVRADGSNIDTLAAHAALGDLEHEQAV